MRITQSWRVGEYLFTQHRDHGLKDYEGKSLYGFKIDGKESQGNELYASLDEAIAEAIGQKHTGPRGDSNRSELIRIAIDCLLAMPPGWRPTEQEGGSP